MSDQPDAYSHPLCKACADRDRIARNLRIELGRVAKQNAARGKRIEELEAKPKRAQRTGWGAGQGLQS